MEDNVGKNRTAKQKKRIIEKFESDCEGLSHVCCKTCKRVGLSLKINEMGRCDGCSRVPPEDIEERLPIWIDDDLNVRYDIPTELSGLTIAEKMLIQRASPFVPLQHVKHGVFGLCGHVCSFEQDVDGLADTLPRKRTDTVMLKAMKPIQAEIGSDRAVTKAFKVRRAKVLGALKWLTQYNTEYDHIEIVESNLDWIDGDEGSLATALDTEDGTGGAQSG